MNFPSISFIYINALSAFRRFPLAVTFATIASLSAIWYIELNHMQRNADVFLHKIILLSTLGISLFTALTVTLESQATSSSFNWLMRLSGLLLLVLYFFQLPQNLFDAPDKHGIRLALFMVGSHLLVAVAPFLRRENINAFWQYNKTLFLRFLTSFLYSNVLYVGLVVALLSIDYLLGFEVKGERYGQLWVVIVFIFNTWFFLAGIPHDLDKLNHQTGYPKGLKFFTQYVLLPLVSVYMVILYLYAARIIFNWNWPEGWVANLILSFSILGILSLLLLYPIRNRAESKWIRQFAKGYYLILLPLVCMLLLAVWRRISEYGFTENRYFVLISGIWLGGMALYFLISNRDNIKIIPVSLAVLAFLISFGPWGAISVSEHNQIQRLRSILTDNDILSNGKIQKSEHEVSVEDAVQISAGIRYLANVHGFDGIQPWFDKDLAVLEDTIKPVNRSVLARHVVELMGLEYTLDTSAPATEFQQYTSASQSSLRLDSFEWLIQNQHLSHSRDVSLDNIGPYNLNISIMSDSTSLSLSHGQSERSFIEIDLQPMINSLVDKYDAQNRYNIPRKHMTAEQENGSAKIRLLLQNIHLKEQAGEWKLVNLSTDILLHFK